MPVSLLLIHLVSLVAEPPVMLVTLLVLWAGCLLFGLPVRAASESR